MKAKAAEKTHMKMSAEDLKMLRAIYVHAQNSFLSDEDPDGSEGHAHGVDRVAGHFGISEEVAHLTISHYGV